MYICMYVCTYVCMYVCMYGAWWLSWLGLGLVIYGSWDRVPPLADGCCPFFFPCLLPPPPAHPAACEWVPGVSWGANYSSFSLISNGPGGTSGAHTTCCEEVAGPPASSLPGLQELHSTGTSYLPSAQVRWLDQQRVTVQSCK